MRPVCLLMIFLLFTLLYLIIWLTINLLIWDLIERTFNRKGSPNLACNDRNAFFTSKNPKNIMHGLVKMYVMHWPFCWTTFFIRFGTKLYRQVVGIPMGTNCASLVADLFLFCYEMDFMMSLSDDKQADTVDAFNNTSRYLDDILNIDNVYFDNIASQIYPSELQLNKTNTSDTETAFLDLLLSISNDIVSSKVYDKRDDYDFEYVNFPLFSWWCSSLYILWNLYLSTHSFCLCI